MVTDSYHTNNHTNATQPYKFKTTSFIYSDVMLWYGFVSFVRRHGMPTLRLGLFSGGQPQAVHLIHALPCLNATYDTTVPARTALVKVIVLPERV